LRFTSLEGLRAYQNMVLREVTLPPGVEEVAERIVERIRERVEGRMWLAVYMRRGDCA
jgi:hypothetical protein